MTWRAYLSTQGSGAVYARDRIRRWPDGGCSQNDLKRTGGDALFDGVALNQGRMFG